MPKIKTLPIKGYRSKEYLLPIFLYLMPIIVLEKTLSERNKPNWIPSYD